MDLTMTTTSTKTARRSWMLWVVAAVCAAPVIAAIVTFFYATPEARSNYGDLIDPQRDTPANLAASTLDGRPFDLAQLRGRWVVVTAHDSQCDDACLARLYAMRQVRTSMGEDRGRIERVWLITDSGTPPGALLADYPEMRVVRADAAVLRDFLPASPTSAFTEHVYMIDPLGHLMLRWPKALDPKNMRKDIAKLLRASRIG